MVEVAQKPLRTLAPGTHPARPRLAQRALVFVASLFFLLTAFRAGWVHFETDFGNYYTAAVLVRTKQPLRKYYDWTWFARQMNFAGIEGHIGAYASQTPLTMLPLVPISGLPPQIAKRVWITTNLILLLITVFLLVRITALSVETVSLLAFCGFYSLRTNFLYGQYYVFLLFLLTLAYFLLVRGGSLASGCVAGIAFALKLYAGPLLLYFAALRNRKATAAMLATILCSSVLAISLFGWRDVEFYGTHILTRSLEGGSIDPYDAGNPAISTLLHRLLREEPELNPHPVADNPELFFFLRTFVNLAILIVITAAVSSAGIIKSHRGFSCFVVATLLLSTNVGSYTYIILLLPLALLWQESTSAERLGLLALYLLLTAPLPLGWLFPKLWLLVVLMWYAGRTYWRILPIRPIAALLIVAAGFAWLDARSRLRSYSQEPGRRFKNVAGQSGAVFSAFPVPLHSGLFFQSIARGHYVLAWFHNGRIENLFFGGQALHPRASTSDGPIIFDLMAHRTSTPVEFDPVHGMDSRPVATVAQESTEATTSPDGKWIAYTADSHGWEQVWIRPATGGSDTRLTGGNCSSTSPAWEPDSKAIIFASDCDRALGLPALYRAVVDVASNR